MAVMKKSFEKLWEIIEILFQSKQMIFEFLENVQTFYMLFFIW